MGIHFIMKMTLRASRQLYSIRTVLLVLETVEEFSPTGGPKERLLPTKWSAHFTRMGKCLQRQEPLICW
jgi:hypothetical protein